MSVADRLCSDTMSLVGGPRLTMTARLDAPDRVTVPEQRLASQRPAGGAGAAAAGGRGLPARRVPRAVGVRVVRRSGHREDSAPGCRAGDLFHVVASGTCWVAIDGGEKHWAIRGDVIVLPYGDQHRMGGVRDAETVSMATHSADAAVAEMPVIRHGEDGEQTDVVCGYLHSQDPLFDPGLRVFPPVFVVRPPARSGR